MARGILAAVEEVFPGTPDYTCHFHSLRDVGKDLLLEECTELRKRLSKFKARTLLRQRTKHLEKKLDPESGGPNDFAESLESGSSGATGTRQVRLMAAYTLIHWALDHRSQSNGFGFPFDRPRIDFFRRIQKANVAVEGLARVLRSKSAKDPKPLESVLKITGEIARDPVLESLAEIFKSKAKIFDRLRFAMRIALPENGRGINDDGKDEDMESIESRAAAFRNWLVEDPERRKTYSKMLKQLDKYWEKLFADPLPVETAEGAVYVQPQRTNNVLERFFRGEKQLGRKKTGTASLNKLIKSTLAGTPLVRNLKNEDYLDIILGDCSSLAERLEPRGRGKIEPGRHQSGCIGMFQAGAPCP